MGDTDPVEAAFDEAGGHRVRRTSAPGDARRLAREAAEGGDDRIVAAGGDGTLREVVDGVRGAGATARVVIGLVPLGTGNDLARSLGLPEDPEAATRLALGGSGSAITSVDLLRVRLDDDDPVWALNAVIVGQGGAVGDALEPAEKARWGPLSYLRGAVEVALDLEPVRMAVTLGDEGTREASILNVVAANGRFAGRGIPIAPGARPDDGAMDVVVVDDVPLSRLMGFLPALLTGDEGTIPDDDAWHQERTHRVRVAAAGSAAELPVSIDGENTAAGRIEVEIEEGALRMAVPSPSS